MKRTIDLFDCVEVDIDFSEKLKVPLKYKPQSMHWSNSQVIVHSGITKAAGEKTYHPYFSDDKVQDHVFVRVALTEMLAEEDVAGKVIILGSDNCKYQYKCTAHFDDCQQIAETFQTTVVRLYSIAGHGKGEVDHVGGIAKVKVRREVAAGKKLQFADQMVEHLSKMFEEKTDPSYKFKEIAVDHLEELRSEQRLKVYSTITGSSAFQVIVFKPGQRMKTAPRICFCEECQEDYGSCSLFTEYDITAKHLQQICLRSSTLERIGVELEEDEPVHDEPAADVLLKDVVVALAAEKKARETFYLMKITQEEEQASKDEKYGWGTFIKAGQFHLRGLFFESVPGSDRKFNLIQKEVIFFRESIVYPFVQLEASKKHYLLPEEEHMQITRFIESTCMGALLSHH